MHLYWSSVISIPLRTLDRGAKCIFIGDKKSLYYPIQTIITFSISFYFCQGLFYAITISGTKPALFIGDWEQFIVNYAMSFFWWGQLIRNYPLDIRTLICNHRERPTLSVFLWYVSCRIKPLLPGHISRTSPLQNRILYRSFLQINF